MGNLEDLRSQLRAAILRGDYAPRQRLIETELTEEYGVSRFIVRQAFIQLAADGIVELQANRGARVREISVPEAIEITEAREMVESLVARRAATLITDEQIESLRQLGEDMLTAVGQSQLVAYSSLNATLHSRLREIARHNTATRMIEQLNAQMVRHQFRLSLIAGRPGLSLPEHLAIIDAVCARDPEEAERAMRRHLQSVIDSLSGFDGQHSHSLPSPSSGDISE